MTQENKDLLLKDLCARLPYMVKMNHIADNEHSPKTLIGIAKDMITLQGLGGYEFVDVDYYKPYLFPLSSMTEEQGKELEEIDPEFYSLICGNGDIYVSMDVRGYDWLNENHFDYRRLIEKGLAIDATNKNIY